MKSEEKIEENEWFINNNGEKTTLNSTASKIFFFLFAVPWALVVQGEQDTCRQTPPPSTTPKLIVYVTGYM